MYVQTCVQSIEMPKTSNFAHFFLALNPDRSHTHTQVQIPDGLHTDLLKRASRAITFLTNLTTEIPLPGNRVKKAAMPMSAFRGAKALAFVFRRKYGFLGSYQREIGFILKKIVNNDGTITWGPPLFIQSRAFGFGATVGYFRGGFCTAILDDVALEFCMKNRILFTARGTFLVDMNGAQVRHVQLDSSAVEDNVTSDARMGTRANYFRAEAMLVDFSVNIGRMSKWKSNNTELYGSNVSADDILSGRGVECPSEFLSVIDVLKRQTSAAMAAARPTGAVRSRSGQLRDSSFRMQGGASPRDGAGSRDASYADFA